MTLENTLHNLTANNYRIGDKCAFQSLYDRLPEADQKALEAAIKRKVPTSIIVKALRQEGHQTSNDSARAHLKGECRCQKA